MPSSDAIYFCNCINPNTKDQRSAVLHYFNPDLRNQDTGRQPDQFRYIETGSYATWEGVEWDIPLTQTPMDIRFLIEPSAGGFSPWTPAGLATRVETKESLTVYRSDTRLICTLGDGFCCFRIYLCTAIEQPFAVAAPPAGTRPVATAPPGHSGVHPVFMPTGEVEPEDPFLGTDPGGPRRS